MKKNLVLLLVVLLSLVNFSPQVYAQKPAPPLAKPKLIVGLVIDQMRWDFLYRYQNQYRTGGFKRLLAQGFACENTMIPYVPTYTAIGHSCVYTGSVPAIMGIAGNNWFEKTIRKSIYCTSDSTVQGVGSSGPAGQMSPRNLWANTITDELRLATSFRSKVIGISLKDRGSILPAGHAANAAYWYDNGNWISSTYYMNNLPTWVADFNDKKYPDKLLSGGWNTLLPINQYTQSTADDKSYEGNMPGFKKHSFPYFFESSQAERLEALRYTPFGATLTFDFAKQAIENEKMGMAPDPDFLCVSISSTDYAGHAFGPNSVELQDTYLRLDVDIENFLTYLDSRMGKNNYLVFLTADHGVAHVPGFLLEHKLPGGDFREPGFAKNINKLLDSLYGLKQAVLSVENYQVYLDIPAIEKSGKELNTIIQTVVNFLQSQPGITDAFELKKIATQPINSTIKERIINGYCSSRSGDIQFLAKPSIFSGYSATGTNHGSWNPYDAHIPLIWFGWEIKAGKSYRETYMTDIAPTLAALLQIQMPNGCVGHVIQEIVK